MFRSTAARGQGSTVSSPQAASRAEGACLRCIRRDVPQSDCSLFRLRRCKPPPPTLTFFQGRCFFMGRWLKCLSGRCSFTVAPSFEGKCFVVKTRGPRPLAVQVARHLYVSSMAPAQVGGGGSPRLSRPVASNSPLVAVPSRVSLTRSRSSRFSMYAAGRRAVLPLVSSKLMPFRALGPGFQKLLVQGKGCRRAFLRAMRRDPFRHRRITVASRFNAPVVRTIWHGGYRLHPQHF